MNGIAAELASVPLDVSVVDMPKTNIEVAHERMLLLNALEEVQVVRHERRGDILLEHDDIGVVDGPVRVVLRDERRIGEGVTARGLVRNGRERTGEARSGQGHRQERVEQERHGRRR